MEVLVDGKRGVIEVGPSLPFRALFEALQKYAGGRNRVIVSMTLDKQVLSRERRAALADSCPGDRGLLEVRTADLHENVLQTIEDLLRYTGQMESLHEEVASLMGSSKSREALEKSRDCFQGWLLLVSGVAEVAALTRADLISLQAGGASVDAGVRRVQVALMRFQEAFAAKDAARAGGQVQNELRPLLREWILILEALRTHASARGRASDGAPPQID